MLLLVLPYLQQCRVERVSRAVWENAPLLSSQAVHRQAAASFSEDNSLPADEPEHHSAAAAVHHAMTASAPVQGVGGGRHLCRGQLQLLAQPLHHAAPACRAVVSA